ncbi:MAG: NADP-dependent phosphogluconate dehydrogenase [Thermomicrobiales bacterium]|nr:NADP-dependent phosphogluconate dehydrogenase [Thermomicrobiales bacterium]
MGENLALNIERNGFPLAVYNRTTARTEEFLAERAAGRNIIGESTIEAFVNAIERPRRIIIMVKAGAPVDAVLAELAPFLGRDDIVIDGGNSLFSDTARRSAEYQGAFRFVGMGISGGEEGALNGPSLMPGGPKEAYDILEPMLTAIAAKTEAGACVTHIGPGGAGHYVKMVHNGIEYADMQLIAETYDLLGRALGLTAPEIGEVFAGWNQGRLSSYLVEITAEVLATVDRETGNPLVDMILDTAEQKGTGRWTSQSALDLGSPIPAIDAAVFARSMSSRKAEREVAAEHLFGPGGAILATSANRQATIDALENALYFAKISAYAQGMALLQAASAEYDWELDLAEIARIWKGGCIIRAALLDPIREAYGADPGLANLMLAPFFSEAMNANAPAIRQAAATAVQMGIPVPALSASLTYVDTWRSPRLPANLLQALRDNFGAHTYRRIDREGVFHTHWATGETELVG